MEVIYQKKSVIKTMPVAKIFCSVVFTFFVFSETIGQEKFLISSKKVKNRTTKGYQLTSKLSSSFWYKETKNYLKKYKPVMEDSSDYLRVYGSISEISPLPSTLYFHFESMEDSLTEVWLTIFQNESTIESNKRLAEETSLFLERLNFTLRKLEASNRLKIAEDSLLLITKEESKTLKKIDILIRDAKRKDSEIKKLESYLKQAQDKCHQIYTDLDSNTVLLEKIKLEVKERKKEVESMHKEVKEMK